MQGPTPIRLRRIEGQRDKLTPECLRNDLISQIADTAPPPRCHGFGTRWSIMPGHSPGSALVEQEDSPVRQFHLLGLPIGGLVIFLTVSSGLIEPV